MKQLKLNFGLLFSTVTVNLMTFAASNAYAWSSTVLISLKSNDAQRNPLGRPVTLDEESWITALLSLGASICPFLASYISDSIGRKKTLLLFALPLLISHLMVAYATTVTEYYIARFIMGIGTGSVYTIVPVYVGEIAETNIRGFLGCLMGVFAAFGALFVYVVGPFVNITVFSFILIIPLCIFLVFFGLFVPESPYYLLANEQEYKAEMSLYKIRNSEVSSILKELAHMREIIDESKSNVSFCNLMKSKSFRKGITITTMLMYFQQFLGITIIYAYMESIFVASGSSLSASVSTIIVAVIQNITVIIASFLADKWGRKILLLISSTGCALSMGLLGTFFYMKNIHLEVSHLGWLPICSLMLYMFAFNFAFASIPWALVGELFISRTKAIASTLTAFTCLFLAFILSLVFPKLTELIGFHGAFWLFSINGVICIFFVLNYVPETKGKNFQDIQKILEQ